MFSTSALKSHLWQAEPAMCCSRHCHSHFRLEILSLLFPQIHTLSAPRKVAYMGFGNLKHQTVMLETRLMLSKLCGIQKSQAQPVCTKHGQRLADICSIFSFQWLCCTSTNTCQWNSCCRAVLHAELCSGNSSYSSVQHTMLGGQVKKPAQWATSPESASGVKWPNPACTVNQSCQSTWAS